MNWKALISIVSGMIVFEAFINLGFLVARSILSLGPDLYSRAPELLLFIVPFGFLALVGVRGLVKEPFARLFLYFFVVWECINYAYIVGINEFFHIDLSGTFGQLGQFAAIVVTLAPFAVVYWASALAYYMKRRRNISGRPGEK